MLTGAELLIFLILLPICIALALRLKSTYYSTAAAMIIKRSKSLSEKILGDMLGRGEITKLEYCRENTKVAESFIYYDLILLNRAYRSNSDLETLKQRLIDNISKLRNLRY